MTTLTETQQKFIELSKQVETAKKNLKELNLALESLMLDIGIGQVFQDPSDKTVFKISQPTGTYIEFKKVGYDRTKREGEAKGSLSQKEAKELGFEV